MPSQIMQYNDSQNNRPTTAAGVRYSHRGNSSLSMRGSNQGLAHLSVNAEKVKRFRSDFPNLPGFSKFSTLRPHSPKVRTCGRGLFSFKRAFASLGIGIAS